MLNSARFAVALSRTGLLFSVPPSPARMPSLSGLLIRCCSATMRCSAAACCCVRRLCHTAIERITTKASVEKGKLSRTSTATVKQPAHRRELLPAWGGFPIARRREGTRCHRPQLRYEKRICLRPDGAVHPGARRLSPRNGTGTPLRSILEHRRLCLESLWYTPVNSLARGCPSIRMAVDRLSCPRCARRQQTFMLV